VDNVVTFSPVALAAVVGLPWEGGRNYWRAALRLRRYVNDLPGDERAVMSALFGLYGQDKSVREVARQMRLTPEAVVRIEERALGRLRQVCGTKSMFAEAA